MISAITRIARNILAVLQPMTGERASGALTFTADAGTTASIAANTFVYPIVDGRHRPDILYRVIDGPEDDDSWTVTDAGTSVSIVSNVGGEKHNLPTGTQFTVWPPGDDSLSVDSIVAESPGLTGATNPTAFGSLHEAVIYESLDGPNHGIDLRRSQLGMANGRPVLLLAWQSTEPADGSAVSSTRRATRVGANTTLYKSTYTASIISSRNDGDMLRRTEGLAAIDRVLALLTDRRSVDSDVCLSNPGGLQVRTVYRESGPQDVYQRFYIYTIELAAMHAIRTEDNRTFNNLATARIDVDKPDDDLGDYRIVTNNKVDMT